MDLMKKYLSRVKPGSREKELKVNMKEVINTLQVKEPVYTFEK